jgi:type I restriction enzyme S subunit
VDFRSGGTPNRATDAFWNGEIPWISAKDLKQFDIVDSVDHLTAAGAKHANLVAAETILILVRGMGLFKNFPVGIAARKMAFNQDIKALIPKAELNSRFLAYALVAMRSAVMGRVDRSGHGTGRLATDYLEALPILFPPLLEQQRIVQLLATWDRAVDHTERLIAAKRRRIDALIMSTFASARDLSIDPPSGWRRKSIGALAQVVGGGTPDTSNPSLWNGSVLWCTPTDITSLRTRHIATTARKISDTGLRSSSATLLPVGSVVLCSRASVGICAISTAPMSTNQGFQSLVPKNGSRLRTADYPQCSR